MTSEECDNFGCGDLGLCPECLEEHKMIKCKGWDTRKKVMYSAEEMGRDQLTLSPDGRGFINVHGSFTYLSTYCTHIIPLQFAGFHDDNGEDLWDGDKIDVQTTNPCLKFDGIIAWDSEDGLWEIIDSENKYHIERLGYAVKHYTVTRVGSIYDNPKLLEQEGDEK